MLMHLNGTRREQRGQRQTIQHIRSIESLNRTIEQLIAQRTLLSNDVLAMRDVLDNNSSYYVIRDNKRRTIESYCYHERAKEERTYLHQELYTFIGLFNEKSKELNAFLEQENSREYSIKQGQLYLIRRLKDFCDNQLSIVISALGPGMSIESLLSKPPSLSDQHNLQDSDEEIEQEELSLEELGFDDIEEGFVDFEL